MAVPSCPSSFKPGTAAATTAVIELAVACRKLLDTDVFSKSDPMCVLYVKEFGTDRWSEFGRTETIHNSLNPDFLKRFIIDYFFEERQLLRFEIYDVDSESADLKKHDYLGKMECALGEIVSNAKIVRPVIGPKRGAGIISVTAEEQSNCKQQLEMSFCARKLEKKDCCGTSDPFLAIDRINDDLSFLRIHKTEVIRNNLNPTWQPFAVPLKRFGNETRQLVLKCLDWNIRTTDELIGQIPTTLQELAAISQGHTWPLVNPRHSKKKRYLGSGQLVLLKSAVTQISTFMDYIQAGTQVACTIAIDFTGSNGSPSSPSSLHYIHGSAPNEYATAIRAVGDIIQDYDSDKLFPALGFGASLPPDGKVSHEFFVNLDKTNPFCEGIEGVLAAYHKCIAQVQLSGPTCFSPVINHVAKFAADKRNGSQYFILLILTDGIITDMDKTTQAIVSASALPLSIIIVGVGNADFTSMHVLDADRQPLCYEGRPAIRDIVQFMPFREVIGSNWAQNPQLTQARLAREVLAEIPQQFLSYMQLNRIAPGSWKSDPK